MQELTYAPCPKCQAIRINTRVEAQYPLMLVRPGSLGVRAKDLSQVQAIVCTNCAYTELYAENLNNLLT